MPPLLPSPCSHLERQSTGPKVKARTNVTVDVWKVDRRFRNGHRHVGRQKKKNLTVDAGLDFIRDLLAQAGGTGITHFGYGSDATATAAGQTALLAQIARDTITASTPTSKTRTITYFLGPNVGNGNTIREIGLFSAAVGGSMYARAVLAAEIVKTSSITVTFTWTLSWGV
jgi:hypothetical protein